MRRENREIMGKLNELFERMNELKEEIKNEIRVEIIDMISDKNNNVKVQPSFMNNNSQGEIVKDIRREVMVGVKEEEEKRKRECNLVVHGMKKSRERNDKEIFEGIVRDQLELMDIGVEEVIRLGRDNNLGDGEVKPAPTLVRIKTSGQKWAVIGKAKKLRNAGEEFRRVMIVPDLTVREREEDKKIRDELRRRRDNGEKRLYISKGKIVQRNVEEGDVA